jgi:hypothetical protein
MRIWKYIYLGWAVLCVSGGYRELAPGRTRDFILGWPFIVAAFLFFCLMPLAITVLNRRFGVEMIFRRPSFDRPPVSGRDPLQTFRLFSVSSALMTIGACFALRNANAHGVMMFWSSVAMSAGLAMSEGILYLAHWRKIN